MPGKDQGVRAVGRLNLVVADQFEAASVAAIEIVDSHYLRFSNSAESAEKPVRGTLLAELPAHFVSAEPFAYSGEGERSFRGT